MNYRLYSIANMYTSGIHAGIQTAHLVHEMFSHYSKTYKLPAYSKLQIWSEYDKTIIVLNGGYQSNLERLYYGPIRKLSEKYNLPKGRFNEGVDSLNGALTVVGLIVPEYLYSGSFEFEEIKKLRLAS
jgi:hypothetical protein